MDRVTKEKWEDNGRCVLVRSPNPYKFSQQDNIQLSSDQSVQYFLKTASIRTPKSCIPDLPARACQKLQTGSLEEDLTISTLRGGYISQSPVEMTSQGQDLATSSYSQQAPATITAKPVSVAAHRTETMTSTQELSNDCALDLSTKVLFVCLFCCFTSQVNSYGHCGMVSSLRHTFSWASLDKQLTSTSCTYFRL